MTRSILVLTFCSGYKEWWTKEEKAAVNWAIAQFTDGVRGKLPLRAVLLDLPMTRRYWERRLNV